MVLYICTCRREGEGLRSSVVSGHMNSEVACEATHLQVRMWNEHTDKAVF